MWLPVLVLKHSWLWHFLHKDSVSAALKYIFKFAILNFTGDFIVWEHVGGTCCLHLQGRKRQWVCVKCSYISTKLHGLHPKRIWWGYLLQWESQILHRTDYITISVWDSSICMWVCSILRNVLVEGCLFIQRVHVPFLHCFKFHENFTSLNDLTFSLSCCSVLQFFIYW
jgi:hypothetical protein